MFMNTKLMAVIACGAALALGACAGGAPAPTTPTTPPDGPSDPGTDTRTQPQKDFDKALTDAQAALATARTGVTAAVALADAADTAALRTAASTALREARTALETAVATIKALTAPVGDPNRRGRAVAAATAADDALDADGPKLTAAERTVAAAGAWSSGKAGYPRADNRAAASTRALPSPAFSVVRRNRNTGAATDADHADLLDSDSFPVVQYASGKHLIAEGQATGGEWLLMRGVEIGPKGAGNGGDERTSNDQYIVTGHTGSSMIAGMKITPTGLQVQLGGKWTGGLDFMRDLAVRVPANAANAAGVDDEGWDLTLAFGAPGVAPDGNGDFYWSAPLYIHETQRNQNKQPVSGTNSYRASKLGTYEVWLANFLSATYGREPTRGGIHPSDDSATYLKYAAYGSMTFAPEPGFSGAGQYGRVHAFHVGYEAFEDEDGKKTTDISSANAISSGKFVGVTTGFTLPTVHLLNDRYFTDVSGAKRIRGDVELTATISDTSGNNSISGSIKGVEYWDAATASWRTYSALSADGIALVSSTITDDGTFAGAGNSAHDARASSAARAFDGGTWGGAFYGPHGELEVAGSWWLFAKHSVGPDEALIGSFGAKHQPAPSDDE